MTPIRHGPLSAGAAGFAVDFDCAAGFLAGKLDRSRSEIHAGHVPTRVGKSEDVGAGATANVDGTAGFVVLKEVKEFRWTDACIPRRLIKIPVMKKEAAKQVLHF